MNITLPLISDLLQVIDINDYPLLEAKNSNLRHRPIGLGYVYQRDVARLL